MTGDRFADRLDAGTYTDDPVVGVYSEDPGEASSLWVPERLFDRLVLLARAYGLHTLPLLGESEPVRLNGPMIASLVDELDFVRARVDDPLVTTWAKQISDRASRALADPEPILTVEGE
ncbi:MAG: hypothetical protein WCP59_17810 [Actinomycetota bacterium]